MTDLSAVKIKSTDLCQLNFKNVEKQIASVKIEKGNRPEEIKTACREFESLFLNYLLKEMRAAIPKSELFDGGQAQQIYISMFDEQLSKELAQKGGIGLAQMLERSLLQYQNNRSTE